MAIFGGKRKSIQRAINNDWKSDTERLELIDELKRSQIKLGLASDLLWNKDREIRQVGVEVFLKTANDDAVRRVIAALEGKEAQLRIYVMRVIAQLPDKMTTPVIDKLLESKGTPHAQLNNAWELGMTIQGETGKNYLARAIDEAPEMIRLTAMRRLVKVSETKDVYEILLKNAGDPNEDIAAVALEGLGSLKNPRITELMFDRFAEGNAVARAHASKYLEAHAADPETGIRDRMLEFLGQGEDSYRRLVVTVLLASGEDTDVLESLFRFTKTMIGWLRDRVLETLITFEDTILEAAITLLEHEDEEIRTSALVLAEQFDDSRVCEPVCAMLKDSDWWLRISACDILARLKDLRAVPHLVAALEDNETRWAAIDALARIGSEDALKPMIKLLGDKRVEVRLEVVRAFRSFNEPRLINLLTEVMKSDKAAAVRHQAAEIMRDLAERLDVEISDEVEAMVPSMVTELEKPIDKLLARCREMRASDIHMSVGEPPLVRRNGVLERMTALDAFDDEVLKESILSILSPRHVEIFEETGEVDFCHAIPEVGRYRANAFQQRKGVSAAFRVIPNIPPTFADLRIPGRLSELLDYHQGLIVVSGPAGSGKSTTLAALVNLINESKADHVLTLEDPIEFVHPFKSSLVNQREAGTHTVSFSRALRGALRQDPDVIMVGEMRDVETTRLALEASETGHLVIGTMHTTSAISTVERLVKAFPPDEQPQVRMGLSESLKFVVCQSLIPRADGNGRVAMFEIIKGTLSVGNLIRENKTYQIHSQMQVGRLHGMQTKDMAMLELVESGLITAEVAWARADSPKNFEHLLGAEFQTAKKPSAPKAGPKPGAPAGATPAPGKAAAPAGAKPAGGDKAAAPAGAKPAAGDKAAAPAGAKPAAGDKAAAPAGAKPAAPAGAKPAAGGKAAAAGAAKPAVGGKAAAAGAAKPAGGGKAAAPGAAKPAGGGKAAAPAGAKPAGGGKAATPVAAKPAAPPMKKPPAGSSPAPRKAE